MIPEIKQIKKKQGPQDSPRGPYDYTAPFSNVREIFSQGRTESLLVQQIQ